MPLRLSIDPGAEYLLPFAKKKLVELKKSNLINKLIEVETGERIFVQRGLVDQIRITGGLTEYFYLVGGTPRSRSVIDAGTFPNYGFTEGGWKKLTGVPVYPDPGYADALRTHARDSVRTLLACESYAIAASICNSYFSDLVPIANGTGLTWNDPTAYDVAIYAELGSGPNPSERRFVFDPSYGNAYYSADATLQKILEPHVGTFSHSIYLVSPGSATSFEEDVDGATPDLADHRSIFRKYGPAGMGAQLGTFGGYTLVTSHREHTGTSGITEFGQHYLTSVEEFLFKRTHAGWVQTYYRLADVSYNDPVSYGPYVMSNPPYQDGDVVEGLDDAGTVSIEARAPSFAENLGTVQFKVRYEFDGVAPSNPLYARPLLDFFVFPEWNVSPLPAVASPGSTMSGYLGVWEQGSSAAEFTPATIAGHELEHFVCPITGTRYSELSQGLLRAAPADGSPATNITTGSPSVTPQFLYYAETRNTRTWIDDDDEPAAEHLEYFGAGRVAHAQLTNFVGELDPAIAPFHPFGGFCVYRAKTGGVLFGKFLVEVDFEGSLHPLMQAYLDSPSDETFVAFQTLFEVQYRDGVPLSAAAFARNGATTIIA